MSSNDAVDAVAFCKSLVDGYFEQNRYEGHLELKPFEPPSKGLLAGLLRKDIVPIPLDPTVPGAIPCLLLHHLENEKNKDSDVYKFIDANKDICTGLYGTSGAGKTRSILEYLSHNYGLYFVADTSNDFGSEDLQKLIQYFDRYNASGCEPGQSRISNENYKTMRRYVEMMLWVRRVVFDAINNQLDAKLTPYQWLLIQLFPVQALGTDLFREVTVKCITHLHEHKNDANVVTSVAVAMTKAGHPEWSIMAVDEAQVLPNKLQFHFLSEEDNTVTRTAFCALLKAMDKVAAVTSGDAPVGFPLFSGTGMSLEEFRAESKSVVAKRMLVPGRKYLFTNFQPLNQAAVETYLLGFLDNELNVDQKKQKEVPNPQVLEHVARWLRGRPRWAASFLEVYLVRHKLKEHSGTRGKFSSEGAKLVEALDRYLAVHTKETGKRRDSFNVKKKSAYAAIGKACNHRDAEVKDTLFRAIFRFAVGGAPVVVDKHTAILIEVGVAAVEQVSPLKAYFDEPIIIEAGINFFSLEEAALKNMKAQKSGGLREAFEKVMLPALQAKMPSVLENQLELYKNDFAKYSVPSRSSYGVLAVQCDTIRETLEWINEATNAIFEGQAVPFCLPDKAIGPDLIFLMWDKAFKLFISVISQTKFRTDLESQMEALRSITPSLLYHENRGKGTCCLSAALDGDEKKLWRKVKGKLLMKQRKNGCVRLMVQYPSQKRKTAAPGKLDDHQTQVGGSGGRGYLATVSKDNAETLFSGEALDIFKVIKDDAKPAKRPGRSISRSSTSTRANSTQPKKKRKTKS